MKKMMLNEHYGLETATFNGSKIRTSRIEFQSNAKLTGMTFYTKQKSNIHFALFDFDDGKSYQSRYGIGEIVAIAQSYEDAENVIVKKIVSHTFIDDDKILLKKLQSIVSSPGVGNKMFVKAEYMPHQIKITDIRLERLQDISDEDCIKEGIRTGRCGNEGNWMKAYYYDKEPYITPRKAFASLIDKVSSKGTWDKNPWVVVYYYELLK